MKRILLTFIALFIAIPAQAAVINGHKLDLDTATIGAEGNSAAWSTRYSTDPDEDEITLAVYYHNSSNEELEGLRVSVDKSESGPLRNHEFSVRLTSGNARSEFSKAVVDFDRPVILEFVDVRWAPNQCSDCSESFIDDQEEEKVFEDRGILLGNIAPGWETQGNVLVTYKVKEVPTLTDISVKELTAGCLAISSIIDPKEISSIEYWLEYKKGQFGVSKLTDIKTATSKGEVSEVVCNIDEGEEITYSFKTTYNREGDVESSKEMTHRYSEKPIYTFEEEELCQPYLTEYMQVGHENAIEVRKLQNFLNDREGEQLEITGIFEGFTFEAVKRYQEKYRKEILDPWGISEPSGFVYKTTLFHMNRQVCGASREDQCPAFSDYKKIGDTGSEVSKIQTFLKTRNYYDSQVTGYFDLETAQAISKFQEEFSSQILEPWDLTEGTGWWYKTTRRYANWLEGCVDDVLIPGEEIEEEEVATSTEEVDTTVRFDVELRQEDPKECKSWDCFKGVFGNKDKGVNATLNIEKEIEHDGYTYIAKFPVNLSMGEAEVNIKKGDNVLFLQDGKIQSVDDDINLYYYNGMFDRSSILIDVEDDQREYIDDVLEDGMVFYDNGLSQKELSKVALEEFNEMVDERNSHLEVLRTPESIDSMISRFEINGEEFSNQFRCYLPGEESEFRGWRFDMSKGKREQVFEDAEKIDLSIFVQNELEYNGKILCYPTEEEDEVLGGTFLNIDAASTNVDIEQLQTAVSEIVNNDKSEEEDGRDFDLTVTYDDISTKECDSWSCLLVKAFDEKSVRSVFNLEKEVSYEGEKFNVVVPVDFTVRNVLVEAEINVNETPNYSIDGNKERLTSVKDIELYEYTGNIYKEDSKFEASEDDTLFVEDALENGFYNRNGVDIEIDSEEDDGYFDSKIKGIADKLSALETTSAGSEMFAGDESFTCYIPKANLGINKWEADMIALNPLLRFDENETNNFAQSFVVPGQKVNDKQLCFTSGATDTVANGTFLDGYVEPVEGVEVEVVEEVVEEVIIPEGPFNPDLIN